MASPTAPAITWDDAIAHLGNRDAVLRRAIKEIGPCRLTPEQDRSPFESLVRAVAHQQLNGTAAATILGRFEALFPHRRKFPRPDDLAAITDDAIRACGFSRAKTAALRDIAEQSLNGLVPNSRQIARLDDEAIIERLTAVRGVGRWTAEMLLIFKLGRPDVLPVDDFGVRSGFRTAYGQPDLPQPKALAAYGERWRPFRTVAAWYLWRIADRAAGRKDT